jgi:hypothetical protein
VEDALARAVERTVAEGTARLTLRTRVEDTDGYGWLRRRRGGLLGDALRRRVEPGDAEVSQPGAIDFAGARAAVGGRLMASVVVGDREWIGPAGRSVARGREHKAWAGSPLWLFDLCRGIVAAEETAGGEVAGDRCRGYAARADLARVSGTVPYDVAPRPVWGSADDLTRVEFEVWIDDAGRIRRVRAGSGVANVERTLDLHDFGVALPPAYWERFPDP